MNYESITYPDVNNGLGCRVTLWVSGCSHHCPGCHNQCTWDFKSGRPFTQEVKDKIISLLELPYIAGLTLSGGDPMDSAEELIPFVQEIADRFNDKYKTIWLYTGSTWEEVRRMEIVRYLDVLVDGEFVFAKKDPLLCWKGSSNQRVIDVQRTLAAETDTVPVLHCPDYDEN